jgi:hypothetical protein
MLSANFNTKKFTKTLNNLIAYSDGYINEARSSKDKIAQKMAKISINAFYEYLDGLARAHPGMLHHVYEWGQVGNPMGRLYELSMKIKGESANVSAELLESSTVSENGTEPFYNKAEVMELGETIVVSEKDANALFFEIDGQEVFAKGPIVIANPGGEAVRGSFVSSFNEFYKTYFSEIYLRSIKFYRHLEKSDAYSRNIKSATKNSNPRNLGKSAAMQWIMTLPGDDSIGS